MLSLNGQVQLEATKLVDDAIKTVQELCKFLGSRDKASNQQETKNHNCELDFVVVFGGKG